MLGKIVRIDVEDKIILEVPCWYMEDSIYRAQSGCIAIRTCNPDIFGCK